ncbi:MAG: hypothetical protein H0V01_13090 [Bacteroidetes bacterium]|nr:hypothetical protein [Bacteroidota bacterium]HET6245003.1 hypothetical protein [Bacteroidia bacterium]
MKTILGVILLTSGLIATIITTINVIQQTEAFSFLGMEIVISKGDYVPVIISAVVMLFGIVLLISSKGK